MSFKLHIGCGRVYLKNYVNVDVPAQGRFLASERPDLVDAWLTTDGERYYAKQNWTREDLAQGSAPPVETVCDVHGDIFSLPCGYGQADEILARQVFEHLSIKEARAALSACQAALKPGGLLRIDVPDHEATETKLVGEESPEQRRFYLRHLHGNRQGDFGYHLMGYTREALKKLAYEYGFVFVIEEPPLPDRLYPAFCLSFQKEQLLDNPSWTWIQFPPLPDDARCLEIGPGRFPWPRADAVLDILPSDKMPTEVCGVLYQGDICQRTPFRDKEFDFVFASHILEHVDDPELAAAEMSRIGKRGVVQCPSITQEFLFAFEEPTHKWWVSPPITPMGPLRFEPANQAIIDVVRFPEHSAAMHRILRLDPITIGSDGWWMRRWFCRAKPFLNVTHFWEGELKVRVDRG